MSSPSNLKKALLASSCLTALTIGSAQAVVVNEGANDFGGTLNTATVLPSNTTQVNGELSVQSGRDDDYFVLTGLTPGTLVTASLTADFFINQFFTYTSVLDPDSGTAVLTRSGPAAVLTVGSEGLVAFGRNENCGDCGDMDYTINISVQNPQVPVPLAPTAALLGVGVAAMGLRRRQRDGK